MKHLLQGMKILTYLFVIATGSFVNISLQAAERVEFYNGVRGLGMGGASIGVVNDETALLLNPAGMGKLRNAFVTLIDPEIHVNSDSSNALISGGGSLESMNTAQGIVDELGTNANQSSHFGYQLFPSLVLKNFGIGVLYKSFYDGLTSADGTSIDLNYRNDFAAVLGYNISLFDGRLKFGFSGRYITREESFLDNVTTGTSGNDFDSAKKTGTGLGLDAGLILTAPWATLPSLAFVVRDFGNTTYKLGSETDTPEATKQTIDAALSFFPIHDNYLRSSITFELKDALNTATEDDITRRSHFGWELNMGDLLFLRAGWHQKSWTAGFEFAMEMAQFQMATYAKEVGDDGGTSVQDRRYVTKFVFRF